jgi:hypothetical protein
MSFLDARTDQVHGAGRQTAATSSGWQAWAIQAEEMMRSGPMAADSAVVSGAAAEYLGDWNWRLHLVAQRVDELGTNTSSGAAVVDTVDTEAAGFLNAFEETTVGERMHLSRPI